VLSREKVERIIFKYLFKPAQHNLYSFNLVFFDMSKAFDKVRLTGLLFKLKAAGVDDCLLNLFNDYLTNILTNNYQLRPKWAGYLQFI
jgi:hypothetical protein